MIFRNLIYIFQSEDYYCRRFLQFAYTHLNWWNLENRQRIVWTKKARLLWALSVVFFLVPIFIAVSLADFLVGMISAVALLIMAPFIVVLVFWLVYPIDFYLKQAKIKRAGDILSQHKICVIGITGSYGKTSAKEILFSILSQKFNVLKTEENVNTDIGIAEFIIAQRQCVVEADVFIVEMGAYQMGEIARSSQMVRPYYSILTGINHAHLERFGGLENTIKAKFELAENTKIKTFLNFDDQNILSSYRNFSLPALVSASKDEATEIIPKEGFQGMRFKWSGSVFETKLLAEHNISLILLCAKLALELGVSLAEIEKGVTAIQPVKHRLEFMYNPATNIAILDDSYNGNYYGIVSGIEVLERARGRKIVLTPGLVELGDKMRETHEKIARLYVENVDLVLLIDSPMTRVIADYFRKNDFVNFKVYASTQEAHASLAKVLQSGDTILFQNDLTDNYF